MEISDAWRAAALPVGFAIMSAVAAVRLLAVGNWRHVIGALLATILIVGGLYLLQPTLQSLGNLNLLIFFVGIVACLVFAGVPIAFAFGLATFGYQALTTPDAHRRGGRTHRRRNLQPHSAVRSAVRFSRPV